MLSKPMFNSHQIDVARDSHSIFLDFQIVQSQPQADLKHDKGERYNYGSGFEDIEIYQSRHLCYSITKLHAPVSKVVHSNNMVPKRLLEVGDEVTWTYSIAD